MALCAQLFNLEAQQLPRPQASVVLLLTTVTRLRLTLPFMAPTLLGLLSTITRCGALPIRLLATKLGAPRHNAIPGLRSLPISFLLALFNRKLPQAFPVLWLCALSIVQRPTRLSTSEQPTLTGMWKAKSNLLPCIELLFTKRAPACL